MKGRGTRVISRNEMSKITPRSPRKKPLFPGRLRQSHRNRQNRKQITGNQTPPLRHPARPGQPHDPTRPQTQRPTTQTCHRTRR